jgi:hypothetical protein
MKFADKIKVLEKDPKFQANRRCLKAMAYIAKRNPTALMTLTPSSFYIKTSGDPHCGGEYKTKLVEGWSLSLHTQQSNHWRWGFTEELALFPLNTHIFPES